MKPRSSSVPFHYVPLDGKEGLKIVRDQSMVLNDVLFNAEGLARSAISFFSGLFPHESPHFCWGESQYLPWFGKYHIATGEDQFGYDWTMLQVDIVSAARAVLDGRALCERGPQIGETYWRCADREFHVVQMLAIEALLNIEGMMSYIATGDLASALAWQFAAFANISESTVVSMDLLYRSTDSLAVH